MKLWLISQDVNSGYDTYDSAVVAAPDEETARQISPDRYRVWKDDQWHFSFADGKSEPELSHPSWSWADPENVKAEYIGDGDHKAGAVICASFNAG